MLTDGDIYTLNTARKILERVDTQAMREAWGEPSEVSPSRPDASLGRTAEAADTAASAIFNFLNVANNYAKVEMTYEQLHGRPAEVEV